MHIDKIISFTSESQTHIQKVVRSRPSICKNQNIKIYDSSVVCVIYHSLGFFFLEKHGLVFAIYSRVCMEIRVAEFALKLGYSVCKRIK